jgi:hypothetical protein
MIKKEKIFELKIQEDDEVSGIDSISLVDEPAIEVNWIAFKKEVQEDFHIPDGEDDTYLDKLLSKGQPEQELLDEGWEIDRIESVKENFATTPNDDSYQDNSFYRVRYKYALNQNIKQSAIIPTTRQFCRELINKNYVWRIEEVENLTNDFGQSAQFWRGSFNCRHQWYRIFYKKTGDIINKSSINKGKITDGEFPVELSPEWLQPDTVTDKTMANPSPSTVKNLGLSKQGFADKPKVSLDYDGVLSTPQGEELYKELIDAGNDVYIVTSRNESEGRDILDEAKSLRLPQDKVLFTNGAPKSDVLKRIGITKHYDNNEDVINEIKKNAPDVEAIKFGYDVGGLPPYVDQLPKKKKKLFIDEFEYLFASDTVKCENCGWEWNLKDGGSSPYHCNKCGSDNIPQNMSKQHFATDSEKHIVLGPAMIPDQKIFRKDSNGDPYYVYFSSDTIKMIAEKYMRNKYTDNNDTMHDGKAIKDIHVLESWIKEDSQDKSNKYGFESLPVGTWFVSMKVNNPKVWEEVKQGKLNGFSVSGFFEEVAQFSREEMFLYKVAEVLKNIKE